MARLVSIEKAGYYAFPDEFLPAVSSLFAPVRGDGKLLDPCAGEGRALRSLSQAWHLTPYANELDTARAASCRELFGSSHTVCGDLFQLRASAGSFPVVWCNPPYTWDSTSDEKRREFGMMKHAWKWVQPNGYFLWCVYSHHITLDAALYLAKHSRQVDVFRLPGLHLGEYTHVVVVAEVGTPTADPTQRAMQLVAAQTAHAFPELTIQSVPYYDIPAETPRKHFVFAPNVITPEAALHAIEADGAQGSPAFQMLVEPEPVAETVRPVVRPRGGQLALILAAGMFNGLVLPTDAGRAAVRSTVESVEELIEGEAEVDETDEESVEKQVYRTRPEVTITLLDEQGEHVALSGDEAVVAFIQKHKTALMSYLDAHFQPLYTFDYTELSPIFAHAKGGKLYATQKHVVAACYTALQTRRSVLLVGEPGTGKTIMGGTLAAALHPKMQPGQVVIVMCPPHLTAKWERELHEVGVPNSSIKILERVDDVAAFMAEAEKRGSAFSVGIISREMAKSGEGWTPAVNWRQHHIARWKNNAEPSDDQQKQGLKRIATVRLPMCPTCGAPIYKDSHAKLPEPASEGWLSQLPRYCETCGGALWTNRRTFSAPKPGKLFRNPKMPLAKFIAERYPGRVGLYICDEAHECKSTSTDQGEAFSVLANAADKTVGLTGTLYGGNASSLYGIEFLCNPRVRTRYPWGRGVSQWVRDMGVLERVVQYRPQHDKAGKYTGKRRIEQKPKEAPGCSPLLVQEIIDHTVFVGLLDMGRVMPEYQEIPVMIQPDQDVAALYTEAKTHLGQYVADCRMQGDASPMAMYLQALLNWPDAPYRDEKCIHRKRLDRESDEFLEIPVYTIPGVDEHRIFAKEQWLIDTVRSELAQGRGVAVFCHQTGTRDIQPRLEKLLKDHIPAARPFILKGTVAADKREHVLNRQVMVGTNVLICNARLVQTGLDLIDFPTIVFFEIDYSLFVMAQASRRAWRLIQDRPCKTFYPFYDGMMEHQAVELVGRKQQAANLLYGEGNGGLSALHGNSGGNLLAVLAAEIDKDDAVTDLRDLFAQHAHTIELSESVWFTPEANKPDAIGQQPDALVMPVEPVLVAQPAKLPTQPAICTPAAAPATLPVWMTVPTTPKRRRKTTPNVWDAPVIQFTLFGFTPPPAEPFPTSVAAPPTKATQLRLFELPAMYA